MEKRVYISADYSEFSGDRNVVNILNRWGSDNLHKVNFVDMAKVVSGSVSSDPDCRICDLKREFNRQINASSVVIILVGDKTAFRTAGSECKRMESGCSSYTCTPYKQNTKGLQPCKIDHVYNPGPDDDYGCINSLPYLQHEFEQARKRGKQIIVLYNSLRKEVSWLPTYLKDYESTAQPFWVINSYGDKVGNYAYIKQVLGFV